MRILRKLEDIGAWYLVVGWLMIVAIVGAVIIAGYRRNTVDLSQLMVNEAERLIAVVDVSAAAGIHALDEVELGAAQRILDNAVLIELIARQGIPARDTLVRIASENELAAIDILDADGRVIATSRTDADSAALDVSLPEVTTVLDGVSDRVLIGFGEESYYAGKPYGAVVARLGGGAVVVHVSPDRMLALRRQVGLGILFGQIGSREGIRYIVLQDRDGILAASPGVTEMSRIDDDLFLQQTPAEAAVVRMTDYDGVEVLEVVRELVVDDVPLGLVRVGLSVDAVRSIRDRARHQFVILFIAAMVSGAFLFVFIVLRQNYRMLHVEHDRIRREVERMTEETRRSERLASMGRLAAGVAHEVRNPLNAVSIITQRLSAEFTPTSDGDEYRRLLATIGSEIDRLGRIIQGFLTYARPPKLELRDVDLGEVLTGVTSVVSERVRAERIEVATDAPEGLRFRCDPDQLTQAVLNLLLNALDAVGSDGRVTVSAARGNGSVTIRIADSGPGIPAELRSQVFDPYFSTKSTGTGLGLSEVHRVVSAHGGRIRIDDALGGGALLTIILPDGGGER